MTIDNDEHNPMSYSDYKSWEDSQKKANVNKDLESSLEKRLDKIENRISELNSRVNALKNMILKEL